MTHTRRAKGNTMNTELNALWYEQGVTDLTKKLLTTRHALSVLGHAPGIHARAIRAQIHRYQMVLDAWIEHRPQYCGICGHETCRGCFPQCEDPCPEHEDLEGR